LIESLIKEISKYRQGIFGNGLNISENFHGITEEIIENSRQYELQIVVHPKGNKSL